MSVHLMCVIAQAINVIVHTHSLPRQQLASKLILIKSCWIPSLLPEVAVSVRLRVLRSAWGCNGADVSFSESVMSLYLVRGRTARVVAA